MIEKCGENVDRKTVDERKKRPRTAFTAAQIKSLEAEFERNKYLSVAKRLQLSKSLKLTETQALRPLTLSSASLKSILWDRGWRAKGLASQSTKVSFRTKKNRWTTENVDDIKIWFQNRRTKWKRKYTNDLELLAQQYYSSMGVMAPRPIFVGDRLW
uniref:Homeobox domain-containing protein n=1 Tax=Timema cristinae TaxID=61476 RepID=A0A7R9H498_TIMCR|nr:unnamed protein product [Timema cristinae]